MRLSPGAVQCLNFCIANDKHLKEAAREKVTDDGHELVP